MVRFIVFLEMTSEFLRLPLEERQVFIPRWNEVASKYGIKMLFWGLPMGVSEQVVIVYELTGNQELFFVFQREWLGLGTPEAGKFIRNTRTIIVH
jgi:hypothetical protein